MSSPTATARSVAPNPPGLRGIYPAISVDVTILAADTAAAVQIIAARTNYKIVLTKVVFSVTTDAAQTATLLDTTGTAIVLWGCKSSPGIGVIAAEFGDDGLAAAGTSKAVVITLSAAGLAGQLHIEGYYLPVGPIAPSGL